MYDLFPWLFKWISNRKEFHRLSDSSRQKNLEMFKHLKETLNPQRCRGLTDAFMVHMQSLEVRMPFRRVDFTSQPSFCLPQQSGVSSHFHQDNLLFTIMNLFAAGTDTTATTLRWGLLFMAKYPEIQSQSTLSSCTQSWNPCRRLLHLQTRSRRS